MQVLSPTDLATRNWYRPILFSKQCKLSDYFKNNSYNRGRLPNTGYHGGCIKSFDRRRVKNYNRAVFSRVYRAECREITKNMQNSPLIRDFAFLNPVFWEIGEVVYLKVRLLRSLSGIPLPYRFIYLFLCLYITLGAQTGAPRPPKYQSLMWYD